MDKFGGIPSARFRGMPSERASSSPILLKFRRVEASNLADLVRISSSPVSLLCHL